MSICNKSFIYLVSALKEVTWKASCTISIKLISGSLLISNTFLLIFARESKSSMRFKMICEDEILFWE